MKTFDLATEPLRELNAHLHAEVTVPVKVANPGGRHAIAVGATHAHEVSIDGNVGYYCGGMNSEATLRVQGHAGPGLAPRTVGWLLSMVMRHRVAVFQ